MKTVRLISQERKCLFYEHHGIAPIIYEARATIPAVEALRAAGAAVEPLPSPAIGYTITLGDQMPVAWYEAGYVTGYRICAGKQQHHHS